MPSSTRSIVNSGLLPKFMNFKLEFGKLSSYEEDCKRQAQEILNEVESLHTNDGYQKIGITYSANTR